MNIDIHNCVTISVVDLTHIKKVKAFCFCDHRRPSALSNIREESSPHNARSSSNGRSKGEKSSSSKVKGEPSVSANMSVASKVPPPAMSPSRPQQTFYFGQNQEQSGGSETERKQSAVDKV